MKDIYITIDSTWTIEGREPPELELELELEPEQEIASTSRKGKRNERSIIQNAEYQADRGLFWNEV